MSEVKAPLARSRLVLAPPKAAVDRRRLNRRIERSDAGRAGLKGNERIPRAGGAGSRLVAAAPARRCGLAGVMPNKAARSLPNNKHELFAQGLAKGLSADAAYQAAGYKPHRGNAARLRANEIIQRRVDEILGNAAEKEVDKA
jgi:hypothetical protein